MEILRHLCQHVVTALIERKSAEQQTSLWVQASADAFPGYKVNESIWIKIQVKLGHSHNCLCN